MTTYELKPCPFCGVMPHIYWEAWKDISPDAGVWKLEANHKGSCYITHINGTNISGRSSAKRLSQLVEWWNHREELFGNSEQLESGHEKDHFADPGKMVGDLISRQDAIDALSQYPFEKVVNCVSIIEELPSAQPEDWMDGEKQRTNPTGGNGRARNRVQDRRQIIRNKGEGTMNKLSSNEIIKLLENLIGQTEAVGDSAQDKKIEENLMTLIDVTNWCLDGIMQSSETCDKFEYSMHLVGWRAKCALTDYMEQLKERVKDG